MIQITRKEQQLLCKLKNVMTANQVSEASEEVLQNVDPSTSTIDSLVDKGVIIYNQEQNTYSITKEQLQVVDDDPEVEQAWEDFRAVQGNGSMASLYNTGDTKKASAAAKHLEEVLFKKGRLTHMVSSDTHIWVTEDKIEFWKGKGYKEAYPTAVPLDLQA